MISLTLDVWSWVGLTQIIFRWSGLKELWVILRCKHQARLIHSFLISPPPNTESLLIQQAPSVCGAHCTRMNKVKSFPHYPAVKIQVVRTLTMQSQEARPTHHSQPPAHISGKFLGVWEIPEPRKHTFKGIYILLPVSLSSVPLLTTDFEFIASLFFMAGFHPLKGS